MFENNIIILAILGYFGAMLKDSIGQVFSYISLLFRSKIVVDSESTLYSEAVDYVHSIDAKSLRNNSKLSNSYNIKESRYTIMESPDVGNYIVSLGRLKWMIVSMSRQSLMDRELFRISFTFIGRQHQLESSKLKTILGNKLENITVSHGMNYSSTNLRKKSFDTIFIENKESIINKIMQWKESREFYNNHQIPYKLGILLSGVPGTGKTSFIVALAHEMGYDITMIPKIDLDRPTNLISQLRSNTIYVIEDVDRMIVASPSKPEERDIDIMEIYSNGSGPRGRSVESTTATSSMLTHTILQLLDGVTTPDNVIFILTTNNKGLLDPAIYRPGRIALDIELGNIPRELAIEMVESYGLTEDFIKDEVFPINPSYLQNRILLDLEERDIIGEMVY